MGKQHRSEDLSSTSLLPLDTIDYERLFWALFFTPMGQHPTSDDEDWGGRPLFWGPPGASKTERIRAFARSLDVPFYSLKPGAKGEGAFGVIPVPVQRPNGEWHLTYPPPAWAADLGDKPALVHLDEFNTRTRVMSSAMLGLLQEKEIGSIHLGPNVRIFASSNDADDSAGGSELSAAEANRLCHISFGDPPLEAWNTWLLTQGQRDASPRKKRDPLKEQKRVMEEFPSAWAQAAGLMTAFGNAKKSWHRNQPAAGDPRSSKGWPSPRSKANATRALASAAIHRLSEDERNVLVAGYVGEAMAIELDSWIREQDLPNAADFLDGTARFKHNAHRIDRTSALVSSCVALVVSPKAEKRQARAGRLWDFLNTVSEDALDTVAATTVQHLHQAGLTVHPTARLVMRKIRPILDATQNLDVGGDEAEL